MRPKGDQPDLAPAPHTCSRVLTRSSGLVSTDAVQPDSTDAVVCTATTVPVLGTPLLLLLLPWPGGCAMLLGSCSHKKRCQKPYAPA